MNLAEFLRSKRRLCNLRLFSHLCNVCTWRMSTVKLHIFIIKRYFTLYFHGLRNQLSANNEGTPYNFYYIKSAKYFAKSDRASVLFCCCCYNLQFISRILNRIFIFCIESLKYSAINIFRQTRWKLNIHLNEFFLYESLLNLWVEQAFSSVLVNVWMAFEQSGHFSVHAIFNNICIYKTDRRGVRGGTAMTAFFEGRILNVQTK